MSKAASVPITRAAGGSAAEGLWGRGELLFVYFWWVLIVLEPDWFLAGTLGGPFYRIPTLLAPLLLLVLLHSASSRAIYWPFALFLLLHLLGMIFAENRGNTLTAFKSLLWCFLVCVGITALVNTPARLLVLLKIYLVGFIWYGVQGLPHGRVTWHPLINNEDSYGPLMVMGVAFAFYFAVGASSRWWRVLGYGTSLLGCVGAVASFARGAVLSFVAVLGLLWLRSRHKLRTLAAGVVAAAATLTAIEVLFPKGEFWAEMKTISEGTEAGSGLSRWEMWGFGLELFARHPVLGVGANNFGPAAWELIPNDPTRKEFADSSRLYNQALHNIYVQLLCEQGIVGGSLFATMVFDFFRRTRRLRSDAASEAWRRLGGEFDLRSVATGLELAMVAFLLNGFFYNQLYIHWFWTLLVLVLVASRIISEDVRTNV